MRSQRALRLVVYILCPALCATDVAAVAAVAAAVETRATFASLATGHAAIQTGATLATSRLTAAHSAACVSPALDAHLAFIT